MASLKQTDIVTISKQRGGKRDNAGAKLKHGEPTAVIRLPLSLIERIKQGNFENVTESSNDLTVKLQSESVTKSKAEIEALSAELEKYKTANERLAEERDKHYQRVVELENQNRDLKRQPDKLRAEITRLKHLEHDCQAIKANGERCDRPAKAKTNYHGVLINVCLSHQNLLTKK